MPEMPEYRRKGGTRALKVRFVEGLGYTVRLFFEDENFEPLVIKGSGFSGVDAGPGWFYLKEGDRDATCYPPDLFHKTFEPVDDPVPSVEECATSLEEELSEINILDLSGRVEVVCDVRHDSEGYELQVPINPRYLGYKPLVPGGSNLDDVGVKYKQYEEELAAYNAATVCGQRYTHRRDAYQVECPKCHKVSKVVEKGAPC